MTATYQSLFAKKNTEADARILANRARMQRESDMKNPLTGSGISVKEAALRLGISVSAVYKRIHSGKFASVRREVSRLGNGRKQYWLNPVEVFEMRGIGFRCSDADLH